MKIECVKTGPLEENCYVLTIKNECLIIDPGDDFIKIKKLIDDKKVLAVLITHYHFDHVGALDDVINFYKVPVIDYKSNKNQIIGPFKFEMINTPGHKEDAITYYFKEDEVMFVGDFIFKESIGRCDLAGGDISDMKKSIDKIKRYSDKIVLYPGHGDKTNLGYEKKNNYYMEGDLN